MPSPCPHDGEKQPPEASPPSAPDAPAPASSADDDLQLAREEERSRSIKILQLAERSTPARFIDDEDDKLRFTLADCMLVTFGISLGLAGGTWIHPGWFTLGVGVIVLLGLAFHHIHPPETHCMQLAWVTLLAGYLASVIAAWAKME